MRHPQQRDPVYTSVARLAHSDLTIERASDYLASTAALAPAAEKITMLAPMP